MTYRHAALLLAAHGSTQNQDSSRPTREQAERIRQRGIFAEVYVCFWLEPPFYKDVLNLVQSREVYLVPNFISEGYYTKQILPREFSLTGPVTEVRGHRIYHCDPVGTHPSMTEVLLRRARAILETEKLSEKDVCLLIAGHGTPRNENSKAVIVAQVEKLRALGVYGQVEAAFLEEPPFIRDWRTLTALPQMIVVPFFVSDGLHASEDIPALLASGESGTAAASNDATTDRRRFWVAPSLGTEPGMADVILALVEKFHAEHLL
ncbi:MAG: CbiX/SirB N-terminal domain-containing protein [Methylacidiphilales bacterium]|nr:CbiX/SirB N-terminal domain-containing protein [Candidatus Methylacidiphilales bacterium]